MNTSISDLERTLAGPTAPDLLGTPDLTRIHRLGTRRRRARSAVLVVATVTAVAAATGLGYGVGTFRAGGDTGRDTPPAAQSPDPAPRALSPLAKRVLREVPGATQVSAWQVVIPSPDTAPEWDEAVDVDEIAAGPIPLGGLHYTGVTAFKRSAFPHWLYDGVQQIEQEELGDEDGYPVGSTEMGILVENGDAELACMGEQMGGPCHPAYLADLAGTQYYQWGMGTDDFLKPGADMEVFLADDYSRGAPGTIAIGGIDGTDVARADFLTTAGEVVTGSVEADTFSPGDSIFYANVPGELARVIVYDADGTVIEDHGLKACDDPVECEVR
jgi:hypothetical protein